MPIRLIHVGVGGRGKWPVSRAAERDDYESAALVDIHPGNMAEARDVSGLPESVCFTRLADALETVEADAVVVVTPPYQHATQCMEAVKAGKHVLVEKPFALSLWEANAVVREAASRGVCVAVCQNARFSARAATMQRLISEGAYGAPAFGLITRFNFRPAVKHSGLDQHSVLWEHGIHEFDTMRAVFGGPEQVWGHSFNQPWSPYAGGAGIHAWIAFENGVTCGFCGSFMAHKDSSSLRIDLEEGTLEAHGRDLVFRKAGSREDTTVPLDDVAAPEDALLDGFREYIRNAEEPCFSGRENLKTVGLIEAVGVASDRKTVIDFKNYLREKGVDL